MVFDDDFELRLGRIGSRGKGRVRKFAHRVRAAANLARGGPSHGPARARFEGSRIGRGAGAGRLLATRNSHGVSSARRVVVKTRIVRLAGKGAAAARAHLLYLKRDGVSREGNTGDLYDRASEGLDGQEFLDRSSGDRHQFRFIVSAEDGARYEDLKPLTRRLVETMERDLGTSLDWVAVDHHNTGHPHSHIIVRGKDDQGQDLVIARDYIRHGLRERAIELVSLDLGPRTDREIADQLRSEVEQERLTSIDRRLIDGMDGDHLVVAQGQGVFDDALRMGRLRKLERMGLAEPADGERWRLAPGLAETLTRIGERGDIIRTMQRAIGDRGVERMAVDQVIFEPSRPGTTALVGRVLARGLSDELADRHYLLVDGVDGRTHYVDIGRGEKLAALAPQAIVRIESATAGVRDVDRTIAEVASANGGRYSVDLHLRHDPAATERFAEAHVRRLEAMRRATAGVEREASGSWIIAPDHLDRVAAFEDARVRDQPVKVLVLAQKPLDQIVGIDAATWIDRDLAAEQPIVTRDAGFGRELAQAREQRRQWLVEQGLAETSEDGIRLRANLLTALQRRELLRVSGQLSEELGLRFADVGRGDEITGRLLRPVELSGGRFALVTRSRDFVLVPWREGLERQIGKPVSGMLRSDGFNWRIDRTRSGPSMS